MRVTFPRIRGRVVTVYDGVVRVGDVALLQLPHQGMWIRVMCTSFRTQGVQRLESITVTCRTGYESSAHTCAHPCTQPYTRAIAQAPFSTYGESFFITAQNIVLVFQIRSVPHISCLLPDLASLCSLFDADFQPAKGDVRCP